MFPGAVPVEEETRRVKRRAKMASAQKMNSTKGGEREREGKKTELPSRKLIAFRLSISWTAREPPTRDDAGWWPVKISEGGRDDFSRKATWRMETMIVDQLSTGGREVHAASETAALHRNNAAPTRS